MSNHDHSGPNNPARRRLLAGIAATPALAAGLSACDSSDPAGNSDSGVSAAPRPPADKALPNPSDSGIDHFVVVMMENRSFDHFLGWVPGADGIQAGARFPDKAGRLIETFRLSEAEEYGYQGCGKEDPSHSYSSGRVHFNGGKMDGFLGTIGDASVDTDHFPVGYYTAEDLPFFAGCADNWTICDRYFHGVLASTYPNRFYMHAGQTDRLNNTMDISSLPTIWDRLSDAGLSGRYYYNDLPFAALWGSKYLTRSLPYATFLAEAALGTLPNVSFVDPRFIGEAPNGITNDDHPQADVRNGQAFLNAVYDAVRNGPLWQRTLMVVVYDEWGGFFDHVVPPVAPVTEIEKALPNDGRLGFRVPCVLIGPRAPRQVSSLQFDVNSVLKMICWRFGMPLLAPERSEWSLNMAYALDFDAAPRSDAPAFNVPLGPFGMECTTSLPFPIPNFPGSLGKLSPAQVRQMQHNLEWVELGQVARAHGFQIG
ncbi:alkaline phosphatase family protein [Sinimarinibacterium sp. CAU 1509]|uniref:alkaline phosphatase family protein n=1 Tax=Sinimarinibacterium sp. CAU 1509 TaxID=2562283 RepID=UPI0010AC96E0|nr:alkaline phosphatase family protein [Sinimarinibacterium sp. CAU 1509]TJY62889.1 alkaline phosphatase family protein [Sinimarinibacterium sp. CAU 1509]